MKRFFILFIFVLLPLFALSQTVTEQDKEKIYEAIREMDSGNVNKSIEILQGLQKVYPNDYGIGYELSLAYYRKENYDSAIEILSSLKNHKDAEPYLYQALGNAYDLKGDREKAKETYNEGLKLFPKSGSLYLELGNCELMEKNYIEALLLYEKGIEVDPDFSSNYYRASQILILTNEPLFAALYGTVYRFLDPNSERSDEMGALIEEVYRKNISFISATDSTKRQVKVTLTNKNNIKISEENMTPDILFGKLAAFELTYERGVLASLTPDKDTLTFEDLIQLRGDALEFYLNERKEMGDAIKTDEQVAILKYEKKIKDAGYWRVYNAWLMGNEFNEGYDILEAELDKFKEFAKWQSEHRFVPSQDGLTLRLE